VSVVLERRGDDTNRRLLFVDQMENIVGSNVSNANILYGANDAETGYTWTLSGAASGKIEETNNNTQSSISFENFGQLRGGVKDDYFLVMPTESGFISLDGGLGEDIADYSKSGKHTDITINASGAVSGGVRTQDIEIYIGNNDGVNNTQYQSTLRTDSGENTWTLSASTTGSASTPIDGEAVNPGQNYEYEGRFVQNQNNGGQTFEATFRGFNNLYGGSESDKFVVETGAGISGMLHGRGGNDSLEISSNDMTTIIPISTPELAEANNQKLAISSLPSLSEVFSVSENPVFISAIDDVRGNGINSVMAGSSRDNNWTFSSRWLTS